MRASLDLTSIEERLKALPGWQVKENALERVYLGKSYLDALEKLNTIAQLAEEADHHPDMLLSWKKLTVRYWTHTANGITDLDFDMANKVEAILSAG
jgi:4a-hydroxytetrahydrobiopterin dehydratase